jgi:Mpv17 / PMP22 family
MQTINFGFLPEKNRVPFVGACSLLWTIFLSYMKSQDAGKVQPLAIEADNLKKSP